MKEHKKLYKAGKLWVTTTLFALALGTGMFASKQVSADQLTNEPVQAEISQPAEANAAVTTQTQNAAANNQQNSLSSQIQSAQQEVNTAQANYDNAVRNAPKTAGQGVKPVVDWDWDDYRNIETDTKNVISSINQLPLYALKNKNGNIGLINYRPDHDNSETVNTQTGLTNKQYAELTEYATVIINSILQANHLQPITASQEILNAVEQLPSNETVKMRNLTDYLSSKTITASDPTGLTGSYYIGTRGANIGDKTGQKSTMLSFASALNYALQYGSTGNAGLINTIRQVEANGEHPFVNIVYSYKGGQNANKPVIIIGTHDIIDDDGNLHTDAGTPLANTGFVDAIRAAQAGAPTPNLNDPSVVNAKNRLNQAQAHLQQLLIAQSQQSKQNQGHLDSYQLTSQGLHVTGWHVAGAGESQSHGYLLVLDNGREVKRVPITPVARPDVQRAYPAVANSYNSGFNQTIALPSASYGHNLQVIARYSSDAIGGEGQHTDFWFPVIKGDNSNNASLDGVQFKNGKLVITGWHATNQAMGHPYHKIIAWDATKNREVSRTTANQVNRADVARVYPGIVNAEQSGFTASFNLVPEFGNDDIQFISRYSSDPNCNTNCVDYWFGARKLTSDQSNRGWLDNVSVQGNKLHVAGWHATNQAMGRPYHSIIVLNANNGQELGRSTTNKLTNRPDLAQAMPGILTASQAGFSTDLNLTPAMVDQPIRIISRWSGSADANSNFVDYWFAPRTLFSDTNNYANLDDFSLHGNQIRVAGWNATNKSYGRSHHFIILFDKTTNREVKRQEVVNPVSRQDVKNAYPNIYNAGLSGFSVNFANNNSLNGHQLQVLSRWTNDVNGNGDAVDYWFPAKVVVASQASMPQTPTKYQKASNIDFIGVKNDRGSGPYIQVRGWMASNAYADHDAFTNKNFVPDKMEDNIRVPIIILLKNGQEVARQQEAYFDGMVAPLNERNDVHVAYPNLWSSRFSGFTTNFNVPIDYNANYQIVMRFTPTLSSANTVFDDMYSPVYRLNHDGSSIVVR